MTTENGADAAALADSVEQDVLYDTLHPEDVYIAVCYPDPFADFPYLREDFEPNETHVTLEYLRQVIDRCRQYYFEGLKWTETVGELQKELALAKQSQQACEAYNCHDVRCLYKQNARYVAQLEQQLLQLKAESTAQLEGSYLVKSTAEAEKQYFMDYIAFLEEQLQQGKNKCAQKDLALDEMVKSQRLSAVRIGELCNEIQVHQGMLYDARQQISEIKTELFASQTDCKSVTQKSAELKKKIATYERILGYDHADEEDFQARFSQLNQEIERSKMGHVLDNGEWNKIEGIKDEYSRFKHKYYQLLTRVTFLEKMAAEAEPSPTQQHSACTQWSQRRVPNDNGSQAAAFEKRSK